MRALVLFSAIVATTACSDSQQATAPRSRSDRPVAGDIAPSAPAIKPDAKPQDQVGFTKITSLVGSPVTIPAGAVMGAHVVCPAGTVVVGGGYIVTEPTGTYPWVRVSFQENSGSTTGWGVSVHNDLPGAAPVIVEATALCVS